jgi:hypothetical protein
MRSVAERELYSWLDYSPTPALRELLHALTHHPSRLMRRNWTDGNRQCLAEFLGARNPECKDEAQPGIAFLRLVGLDTSVTDAERRQSVGSFIVFDWDNPHRASRRAFRRALISMIRREIWYRTGENVHVCANPIRPRRRGSPRELRAPWRPCHVPPVCGRVSVAFPALPVATKA